MKSTFSISKLLSEIFELTFQIYISFTKEDIQIERDLN